MGLVLTFEAGSTKLVKHLSNSDLAAAAVLRNHLPDEMAVCFGTDAFGEPSEVEVGKLKIAAQKCKTFLEKNKKLLPVTFQTARRSVRAKEVNFRSGTLTGIKLPDDGEHSYSMTASVETCMLEKMTIDHEGNTTVVERQDLRDKSELMTTNFGVISIRQRPVKTTLASALSDISRFTNNVKNECVEKTVC